MLLKNRPLTTAHWPVPPALLAPLLIFAPVTGSIQRVDGRLALVNLPKGVERRKELAPVPGLTPEEIAIVEGRR